MKKTIGAFLLFLATSAFKGRLSNPVGQMEMARLRMSLMYVQSIKTFRLLFMSLLGIGVCLTFLLTGLVLFHVSLFLYAPWSGGTKLLVGLACSGIYLIATVFIFSKIFASDKWLKIFHAETIMDNLNKETASPQTDTGPEATPEESAHSLN